MMTKRALHLKFGEVINFHITVKMECYSIIVTADWSFKRLTNESFGNSMIAEYKQHDIEIG